MTAFRIRQTGNLQYRRIRNVLSGSIRHSLCVSASSLKSSARRWNSSLRTLTVCCPLYSGQMQSDLLCCLQRKKNPIFLRMCQPPLQYLLLPHPQLQPESVSAQRLTAPVRELPPKDDIFFSSTICTEFSLLLCGKGCRTLQCGSPGCFRKDLSRASCGCPV